MVTFAILLLVTILLTGVGVGIFASGFDKVPARARNHRRQAPSDRLVRRR